MGHTLVDVLLEPFEVVVAFLLEFFGDGDSLLDEARDMVQHHELFQQMHFVIAGAVSDLHLRS